MQNAVSALEKESAKITKAGRQIGSAGKSLDALGGKMTKAVTLPLVAVAATSVKTAADFEKSIDKIASVMGKKLQPGDIEKLTEKALELGAKMKYSASESADAFTMLAQAGWGTEKMLKNIEGIMYLAGATDTSLANAAEYVASAMAGLGEKSGYTAEIIGNNLATAASSSKTNIDNMGTAFAGIASSVGQMRYSMEDACVILGTLANANIEASEAAMAFNRIVERMSTNKNAVEALQGINVKIYDEVGNARKLIDVFNDLRVAYGRLNTDEEKTRLAKNLGGQYSKKLQAILGSEQSQWDELNKAMSDTTGACETMYKVANDNLTGQLTELSSAIESIQITLGNKMLPYVKIAVKWVQTVSEKIRGLSDEQINSALKWGLLAASIGPVVSILGKTISGIGGMVQMFGGFGSGIATFGRNFSAASAIMKTFKLPSLVGLKNIGPGIAASFRGLKSLNLATALTLPFKGFAGVTKGLFAPLTKLMSLFGTTAKALFTLLGPVGSAVVILAALVAAGILVYKNWDKIKDAAKQLGKTIQKAMEASGFDVAKFKKTVASLGEKAKVIFDKMKATFAEVRVALEPVLKWIGSAFFNGMKVYFAGITGFVSGLLKGAMDTVSGLMDAFGGLLDFISGVFTGDFKKAFNGLKTFFMSWGSAMVALFKTPINGIIGLINSAVDSINSLGLDIPDWVPGIGGKSFHVNLPKIKMLYAGTSSWQGGIAAIHDKGAEIVDLPAGTRVYPHAKSIEMAKEKGRAEAIGVAQAPSIQVSIAKLTDHITVREEADIQKIADRVAGRIVDIIYNKGGFVH